MLNNYYKEDQDDGGREMIHQLVLKRSPSKSQRKAKKIYAFEILDNLDLLQRCRIEHEITQQPKKP